MAVNLADAEQKWIRKTQQAGTAWKAGVTAAGPAAYCAGLAKFGIPESTCMANVGQRWQAGTGAVSAQEFQQAIAGKGPKWSRRFVEGLSR